MGDAEGTAVLRDPVSRPGLILGTGFVGVALVGGVGMVAESIRLLANEPWSRDVTAVLCIGAGALWVLAARRAWRENEEARQQAALRSLFRSPAESRRDRMLRLRKLQEVRGRWVDIDWEKYEEELE